MALSMKNSNVEIFRDECSTTASSNEGDSPRSFGEETKTSPVVKKAAPQMKAPISGFACDIFDPAILSFGAILLCCIAFGTIFISSDIWFECFCSASIGLIVVLQMFCKNTKKAKQTPQKVIKPSIGKGLKDQDVDVKSKCKADPQSTPKPRLAKQVSEKSAPRPQVPQLVKNKQLQRQVPASSRTAAPSEILAPPGFDQAPSKQECLTAALNRAIHNIAVPAATDQNPAQNISNAPTPAAAATDQNPAQNISNAPTPAAAAAVTAGAVRPPPGLEIPLKQKRKAAGFQAPPGLATPIKGLSSGQDVLKKAAAPVSAPPGLSRPSAGEFDAKLFNRELVAILRDLGANSNVGAAVLRMRMQNVPVKRQSSIFVDILTRACEETRGPQRRSFIAFAAGLAAASESAFEKKECLEGLKIFFTEVYDALCDEVTGLCKVIAVEVLPTFRSVFSQEKLDAVVPNAKRFEILLC